MSSEMGESTWEAVLRGLVDVAMGRRPASRLIRNGRWVCVQSGEIIDGTDIALDGQRIAYVGPDASHTIGDDTDVLEAEGRYLVPGLLDGHMHVESGMLTVTEFVRAVMRRGTTGMFIDPHEIANVLGMPGHSHDGAGGRRPAHPCLGPDALVRALLGRASKPRERASVRRMWRRPSPGPASSAWAR